jgi:hypothetical protein
MTWWFQVSAVSPISQKMEHIKPKPKQNQFIPWPTGKELTKTLIFDLKGKLIKTVSLPLKDMDVKSIYPFTIKNGKLYQLVEDFDSENWYLHVTSI